MDQRYNKFSSRDFRFKWNKNLDDLKKYIIFKYPDLKKHLDQEILRFAVNQEYIIENIDLKKNDEIAVFPPVSGG